MSNGASAPRSASARMRSSEVGSAQCRSSKASTTACVRAAARIHAVIAASCRRRNSSGASFAGRSSGKRTSTRGASRGAYSVGSRPIRPRVFSRSAKRCSVDRSAPKRSRPHSAIGCSGVFCNSCDDDHSVQVWRLAEAAMKLLDQPGAALSRGRRAAFLEKPLNLQPRTMPTMIAGARSGVEHWRPSMTFKGRLQHERTCRTDWPCLHLRDGKWVDA